MIKNFCGKNSSHTSPPPFIPPHYGGRVGWGVTFGFLLFGAMAAIQAAPAGAVVSADGFIPVIQRELYHNQESALVSYKVTNTGDEDIGKIEIIIPPGFTYDSIDSTSTTPSGKNWTYVYGGNIVTLSAVSVSSAIIFSESLTVEINVATEEGFHHAVEWCGRVMSTSSIEWVNFTNPPSEREVTIIVLLLKCESDISFIIPGQSTAVITCLLQDDDGAPLGNKDIFFSTHSGGGSLSAAQVTTYSVGDDAGKADVRFWSPSAVGISRIKCAYKVHSAPEVWKVTYIDVQINNDPASVSFERLAFERDGVMYIKEITPIKLRAMYDNWQVRHKIDSEVWQGWVSSRTFFVSGIGEHIISFQHCDKNLKEGKIYLKKVYVTSGETANKLINYPNPFQAGRGQTALEYFLEGDSRVTLEIFDLFGQLVWRREIAPGLEGAKGNTLNQIIWYGRNSVGQVVANGGYLCRLTIENNGAKRVLKRKIGVAK